MLFRSVCAEKGKLTYIASEESAIRVIEPNLDRIWSPAGGEPVMVELEPEAMAALNAKEVSK